MNSKENLELAPCMGRAILTVPSFQISTDKAKHVRLGIVRLQSGDIKFASCQPYKVRNGIVPEMWQYLVSLLKGISLGARWGLFMS